MTRVVLFSGGLDSTALSWLWPHDLRLYVDMHTRYSRQERLRLETQHHPFCTTPIEYVDLPLTSFERPDGIIPMRNLLLAAIASNYGDEIAMGAVAGERMLDKTPAFAEGTGDLLTYLWSDGEPGRRPQAWTEGRGPVRIELPLVNMSKVEIIREVIWQDKNPRRLAAESWSCYEPIPDPMLFNGWLRCCTCKPCVRNWLAFFSAGVYLPYLPSYTALERIFLDRARGEESDLALSAMSEYQSLASSYEGKDDPEASHQL